MSRAFHVALGCCFVIAAAGEQGHAVRRARTGVGAKGLLAARAKVAEAPEIMGKSIHSNKTYNSSQHKGTRTPRNIFIDLGTNWGNTLRLYEDLVPDKAGQTWEIYGFEASPFIQPYMEKFTTFLNDETGTVPKPPVTVPPSGSSAHLREFAPRYGCPTSDMEAMRQCMFGVFAEPLNHLEPDPALKDPALIDKRLATASSAVAQGAKSRFVFVPAAAGAKRGTMNLGSMTAQQMIRGGAIDDPDDHSPQHDVPMVDVVSWIVNNFRQEDFVVAKMDIEGGEFPILNKLLDDGNICRLDILAMECHDRAGSCSDLIEKVKHYPCVKLLMEGSGYKGWDRHSSPDKYYAVDPRGTAALKDGGDNSTTAL